MKNLFGTLKCFLKENTLKQAYNVLNRFGRSPWHNSWHACLPCVQEDVGSNPAQPFTVSFRREIKLAVPCTNVHIWKVKDITHYKLFPLPHQ